ncbi:hypothetical protein M2322_000120 [Rhodoblastus acidophilus]|uniref:hypothetical protein n=1 Tax=Rhodoblastus acidophilus TaxID=1074 RepID=UPI0022249F0E|nr:hypothetical protein [Rhodoblastus acidophilus]MCW2314600.1 hypothetical protein [Rhodoblastus acidophilus]
MALNSYSLRQKVCAAGMLMFPFLLSTSAGADTLNAIVTFDNTGLFRTIKITSRERKQFSINKIVINGKTDIQRCVITNVLSFDREHTNESATLNSGEYLSNVIITTGDWVMVGAYAECGDPVVIDVYTNIGDYYFEL